MRRNLIGAGAPLEAIYILYMDSYFPPFGYRVLDEDNGYHGSLAMKTLCCHSPCSLMADDCPSMTVSVSACHAEARLSTCTPACMR